MGEFLDKADELRRTSATDLADAAADFDDVFEAQSELQGIFQNRTLISTISKRCSGRLKWAV